MVWRKTGERILQKGVSMLDGKKTRSIADFFFHFDNGQRNDGWTDGDGHTHVHLYYYYLIMSF